MINFRTHFRGHQSGGHIHICLYSDGAGDVAYRIAHNALSPWREDITNLHVNVEHHGEGNEERSHRREDHVALVLVVAAVHELRLVPTDLVPANVDVNGKLNSSSNCMRFAGWKDVRCGGCGRYLVPALVWWLLRLWLRLGNWDLGNDNWLS